MLVPHVPLPTKHKIHHLSDDMFTPAFTLEVKLPVPYSGTYR